jgi:ATP phosphoribosyltransferase
MRIALPNKGRLYDSSSDLLSRAGLQAKEKRGERKLWSDTIIPDTTIIYVRSEDIPRYVSSGSADIGITGHDQLEENKFDNLVELLDLNFGKCQMVIASIDPRIDPQTPITSIDQLQGKRIATEFPKITKNFFEQKGIDITIIQVGGATELAPHVDMADAIVDIVSTGETLRSNNLVILEKILDSSARLIAREDMKNSTLTQQITAAIQSVIHAETKRYIMMNAPRENLENIKRVIPGLSGPTVIDTYGTSAVVIHAVVDEKDVFGIISALQEQGATGILVTTIERLID